MTGRRIGSDKDTAMGETGSYLLLLEGQDKNDSLYHYHCSLFGDRFQFRVRALA
jgi:hypothetical protein